MKIVPVHEITDKFVELANAANKDGHRNISRLIEEFRSGINRFDRRGEVLYGLFNGPDLVGVGGLNLDPFAETRAGRVRRLFVTPGQRYKGCGTLLMDAIEGNASKHFAILNLFTTSERASAFYVARGYHLVADTPNISHRKTLTADQAFPPTDPRLPNHRGR